MTIAALTLLVMLAAGCSPGGDEAREDSAAPGRSPTATASSPSAVASPSATDSVQTAEAVDPCDLVSRSDWAPFVSRSGLKTKHALSEVPRLDPGWSAIYNCDIVHQGLLTEVSFGYSYDDVDYDAAWRRYRPLDISLDPDKHADITHRAKLSGIGDRAFIASDLIGRHAFAQVGDVVVSVGTIASNAPSSQIAGALQVLALQASPSMLSRPIDLPATCPPADDRRITDLIGAVEHARGARGGPVHACDYASPRGTLRISLTGLAPGMFRYESHTGAELPELDAPAGLVESWTGPSRENDYTAFALDRSHHVEVEVALAPTPNRPHALAGATPKKFLALFDHYLGDYTKLG